MRIRIDPNGAPGPDVAARQRINLASLLAWVDRCADLFDCRFDGLSIELRAGAPAFAEPERIVLPTAIIGDFWWNDGALGRSVVAHELAHVAQFRLAAPASSVAPSAKELEAEASIAAVAALAGLPCRCQLANRGNAPRYWNRVGHYYTVYLLQLLAGLDPQVALRMAVLSQLPDEAAEFEAVYTGAIAGTYRLNGGLNGPQVWDGAESGIAYKAGIPVAKLEHVKKRLEMQYSENDGKFLNDASRSAVYGHCRIIQRGLHCLTGGGYNDVRSSRKQYLQSRAYGSLEFGVALHSFGDSFAHSQEGWGNGWKCWDFPLGHGLDGHWPDHPVRRGVVYQKYCRELYDIFISQQCNHLRVANWMRFGESFRPWEKTVAGAIAAMISYCGGPEDSYESTAINTFAHVLSHYAPNYHVGGPAPDYDAQPWASFLDSSFATPARGFLGWDKVLNVAKALSAST